MKPTLLLALPLLFAAAFAPGCAEILGTSEYKPCTDGAGGDGDDDDRVSCDGGSGGSSTGATTSSSSSSSSSSTATECFDVTVNVTGNVKVHLSSLDVDFEIGFSGPVCVPAGSLTLSAECDTGGGTDPPVAVDWGNDECVDDMPTCMFTLTEDEQFIVDADDDCP